MESSKKENNENIPLINNNYKQGSFRSKWKKKQYSVGMYLVFFILFTLSAAMFIWLFLFRKNDLKTDDLNNLLSLNYPLPDIDRQVVRIPHDMLTNLDDIVDDTRFRLSQKSLFAESLQNADISTPSYKHQHLFIDTLQENTFLILGNIENEISTNLSKNSCLKNNIDYTSEEIMHWLSEDECFPKKSECKLTKYRSLNGFCNNLKNQNLWGVAMKPFRRLLPPEYEDCISEPRGGFVPTKLPSAREVSVMVHRPIYKEDSKFTLLLSTWGQFIDHDITATALSKDFFSNGSISCCNKGRFAHSACFPVIIPAKDQYYSKYNATCMEFIRSASALRCSFGPREQLNEASGYLDGSMIYGNNRELAEKLRALKNGKMAVTYTEDGRSLLPISTDLKDGCNTEKEMKKGRFCFLTGDRRANENTYLTMMHLLFVRQHNKISENLASLNPTWNDDLIYEETRRIIIAQVQHITYNEFVPIILGKEITKKLDLPPSKNGYWKRYNDSLDGSIANSFATAAFRFAHTLIPSMVKISNGNGDKIFEKIEIRYMFFNPQNLYIEGKMNRIMEGALNTHVEKADNLFTSQLTEHLFENVQKSETDIKSCGLDLVSLNIQRGRDHGLAGYPKWRQHCGLSRPTKFEHLLEYIDEKSVQIISTIYKNVDDIDLYTGALSEIPIKGGLLGPTFTCLIADQFFRIKYADRFWYETDERPQSFTPEQLEEIRKTTLAGIICGNIDKNLRYIQSNVMESIHENNLEMSCDKIHQLNLTYWINKR